MSQLEVNKINPATGTDLAVGDSGDTITITAGATLGGSGASLTDLNASQITTGTIPDDARLPTVGVDKGGTNLTSYAVGDVIYASGTTTLAKLSKPGTPADEVLTFATGGSAPSWVALSGGTSWQSVVTGATLTAVAGNGYPINTTSNACTVTLPAGSVGDTVELVDYAGTWDTNKVTLAADGSEKIKGSTTDRVLQYERQGVRLVYVDATQGWVVVTGVNETNPSAGLPQYTVDFLCIAGGAGGGGNGGIANTGASGGGAGGYRNSYSSEASGGGGSSESSLTFNSGTVYTITIGGGGANGTNTADSTDGGGRVGVDSSISGSDITDITSDGGGSGASGGGTPTFHSASGDGGSGGGTNYFDSDPAGSGTTNQGYGGGKAANDGGGGGGGGASAAGDTTSAGGDNTGCHGGNGLSSSITGAGVSRGGGGGGGYGNRSSGYNGGGDGGTGGGGNGGANTTAGANGSANTGGGAGAGNNAIGGSGGSGVVILRMLTADYSGTTTGSPSVSTDGSDTILIFNASGSYTG